MLKMQKSDFFCLLQKSYIAKAITSAKYIFLVEHGEHSEQATQRNWERTTDRIGEKQTVKEQRNN